METLNKGNIMTPQEKTFRTIISKEREIAILKADIDTLRNKAVTYGWARFEITISKRSPAKDWWLANQPELYAKMIKHYKSSETTSFRDDGYKTKLKKLIGIS